MNIRRFNESSKGDLMGVKYSNWESEWKRAFEIAKSSGSCLIPGDSYLNVFRQFYDKLLGLYIYEGNLYSITPISNDVDYGGYGEHKVELVNKSDIINKLNNILSKIS